MSTQFAVGEEAILLEGGKPVAVVAIIKVTPGGLVDATTGWNSQTERWNADGSPRGSSYRGFRLRRLVVPTPSLRGEAIANTQRAAVRKALDALSKATMDVLPADVLPDVIQHLDAAIAAIGSRASNA